MYPGDIKNPEAPFNMPPHPYKQDKKHAKHEVQNYLCIIEGKITELQLVFKGIFPFILSVEDKDTSTWNVSTGVHG